MEIQEMQKQSEDIIDKIDKKLDVEHDDELTLIHLTEELGDVAKIIMNKKLKRKNEIHENLDKELADVVLLISRLANNNNINLEYAFINKINNLKLR